MQQRRSRSLAGRTPRRSPYILVTLQAAPAPSLPLLASEAQQSLHALSQPTCRRHTGLELLQALRSLRRLRGRLIVIMPIELLTSDLTCSMVHARSTAERGNRAIGKGLRDKDGNPKGLFSEPAPRSEARAICDRPAILATGMGLAWLGVTTRPAPLGVAALR